MQASIMGRGVSALLLLLCRESAAAISQHLQAPAKEDMVVRAERNAAWVVLEVAAKMTTQRKRKANTSMGKKQIKQ